MHPACRILCSQVQHDGLKHERSFKNDLDHRATNENGHYQAQQFNLTRNLQQFRAVVDICALRCRLSGEPLSRLRHRCFLLTYQEYA